MITQIYEIQTPYEAEACIEAGVEHLGSVLLSKENWRVHALKEGIRLSQDAGTKNSLIPLFREIDSLYRALDYYRPHYIHFCDSLTDQNGRKKDLAPLIQFQSDLKEKFPEIGIIRSIPVPRKGVSPGFPSLKMAQALEPVTEIFLTDTWLGKEPVQGFVGITGKTADWDVVRRLVEQSNIPVILAGGLSPENVYEAIIEVQPAGADSCTLTNLTDKHGKPVRFRKDFSKVKRFMEEVRRAEKDILCKAKKQGGQFILS